MLQPDLRQLTPAGPIAFKVPAIRAPIGPRRFPLYADREPHHDYAFERILNAAYHLAKAENCPIERLLIDGQFLTEAEFYQRLASYLGVPFLPFPVGIDPAINPHDALAVGLAPVDRHKDLPPRDLPTFIYAPQGERLEWFVTHAHTKLVMPDARIALTTPKAFQSAIRATFGQQLATRAQSHLRNACPAASAGSARSSRWLFGPALLLMIIASSLCLSEMIWHGALLALTLFPILPGIMLKILALHHARRGDLSSPLLADCDLPTYTILVPLYREAAVLPQLIGSLQRLDYPRTKLDIKLLVEADDTETLAALDAISLPPSFDVLICPRGQPRTKPRALTIGLAYTKSDFVVIYDAEDSPEPDQLKKAASIFAQHDDRLACLQARLTIDNLADTWFTRQFALEYAALFDVLLPGLAAMHQPIPLGGTSNHFRRRALNAVAAWDPWNVTEDADLGLRLFRSGYRVRTFNSTTFEEAPTHCMAWINQRTRWLKGWLQTTRVHLRPHGRARDKIDLTQWIWLVLTASLSPLCVLLHPAVLMIIDMMIAKATGRDFILNAADPLLMAFAILWIGSLGLDFQIARLGAQARQIKIGVKDLLGLIPYSLLKTWAGWRALIELLYAPYHWRKTAHGLAKTSRRRAAAPTKTAS